MVIAANIIINWWSILTAGAATVVLGYFWYSPKVMGTMWLSAIGKKEEEIRTGWKPISIFWTVVLSLLTAYILSHFIQLVGADTLADALATAFWAWLGFVMTVVATNTLYEQRPFNLIVVNSVYQLLSLLIMAAILFSWR